MLHGGSFLNLQYIYGTLSNRECENPLDFERMTANPMEWYMIATDATTGKPKYFTRGDMRQDDYRVLMASCCIPVACKPIEIGGVPYYDGALGDTIPLQKAFADGCDKVVLILTKPLGIGVLTTAAKAELCSAETMRYAVSLMTTLNKGARDAMVKYRVHACTDVTGFGLLGHSCEMAEGSGVAIEYEVSQFRFIEEAIELAKEGLLPEGMYRNRAFAECRVDPGEAELWQQDLLYDPQTSGGLLMAVDPEDVDALLRELEGKVPAAQRIGRAVEYDGGAYIRLR